MKNDNGWDAFRNNLYHFVQSEEDRLAAKLRLFEFTKLMYPWVLVLVFSVALGSNLTSIGVLVCTGLCLIPIVFSMIWLMTDGDTDLLPMGLYSLSFALIMLGVHYKSVLFSSHV